MKRKGLSDAREREREFLGISLSKLDAAQWPIGGHRLQIKTRKFSYANLDGQHQ